MLTIMDERYKSRCAKLSIQCLYSMSHSVMKVDIIDDGCPIYHYGIFIVMDATLHSWFHTMDLELGSEQ